jgi:diadenosine tetraphosphate (Ap4A) HIT family hydrolase
MNAPFQLDPRLKADCTEIGDLGLCKVLLMNDARYPWVILVPRLPGLVEITDLQPLQRTALYIEVEDAMQVMQRLFSPHKLNVAALGNSVRQLHVHVIARQENDEAWPKPVWARGEARKYTDAAREELVRKLAQEFGL